MNISYMMKMVCHTYHSFTSFFLGLFDVVTALLMPYAPLVVGDGFPTDAIAVAAAASRGDPYG